VSKETYQQKTNERRTSIDNWFQGLDSVKRDRPVSKETHQRKKNVDRPSWFQELDQCKPHRTFIFRFGIDHKGLVNHIRGPGNFRYQFFSIIVATIVATFRTGFFSDVSESFQIGFSSHPVHSNNIRSKTSRPVFFSGLKPRRPADRRVCASFRSISVVSGTEGNNFCRFHCTQPKIPLCRPKASKINVRWERPHMWCLRSSSPWNQLGPVYICTYMYNSRRPPYICVHILWTLEF